MRHLVSAAALAVALGGCASKSSDITPAYISPIMYQNHSCPQLAQEAQGVSARAAQLSGAQDQKRTNDQIATGVAVVIFWPAAFLVGGDGPVAAELAQLKGQMVAIEQASIQKRCGITFQRTASAGEPTTAYAVQQAPPEPPPASAPARSRQSNTPRTKNPASRTPTPPPAPAPQTVVIEPPPPTLSEGDQTMMRRN